MNPIIASNAASQEEEPIVPGGVPEGVRVDHTRETVGTQPVFSTFRFAFDHRARAARLAIAILSSELNLRLRALPPN